MSKGGLGDAIIPSRFWPPNVPESVGTPRLDLYEALLGRWARDKPTKSALISGDSRLSYAELDEETDAVSRSLPPQAKAEGALAAIAMDFCPDFFRAFFGLTRAGCGVVLLDPSSNVCDATFALQDSKPKVIVASDDMQGRRADLGAGDAIWASGVELAEWISRGQASTGAGGRQQRGRVDRDSTAVVFYARTGLRPLEAVYHSHTSIVSSLVSFATFMGLDEKDTYLCSLPPWDWAGFYGALSALFWGGTVVVPDAQGRDDFIGQSKKYGATFSFVRPESLIVRDMGKRRFRYFSQKTGDGRSPLRWLGVPVASNNNNNDGLSRIQKRFERANDIPTLLQYGSYEVGPCISNHWSWNVHGALGIPITNVRLRLADMQSGEPLAEPWELAGPGELALSGPTVMKGYKTPESNSTFLKNGWFHTGRLVQMDPNGVIHPTGRISRVREHGQ